MRTATTARPASMLRIAPAPASGRRTLVTNPATGLKISVPVRYSVPRNNGGEVIVAVLDGQTPPYAVYAVSGDGPWRLLTRRANLTDAMRFADNAPAQAQATPTIDCESDDPFFDGKLDPFYDDPSPYRAEVAA